MRSLSSCADLNKANLMHLSLLDWVFLNTFIIFVHVHRNEIFFAIDLIVCVDK